MKDLQKNICLLKSEIMGNKGGEIIIVIMLTAMMICANIMLVTVGEYIGAVIFYSAPDIQNTVKIRSSDEFPNFSEIKRSKEAEYSFEVYEYHESFGSLYAVSEELFDYELPFLGKENIDNVKNVDLEYVPLLVSWAAGLNVGDKGRLSCGSEYKVVDIISDENIKYMLYSAAYSKEFAITVDKGQFSGQKPITNPILFAKLSKETDISKFNENINSIKFSLSDFDPFSIISTQFSDSITVSVIGTVVFAVSFFAVIINCYLVFCGKRRYYNALMTVGGKKKIFLFNGAVIKAAQLLISSAVSVLILLVLNILTGSNFVTLMSGFASVVLASVVLFITWLMLNRWIIHIMA